MKSSSSPIPTCVNHLAQVKIEQLIQAEIHGVILDLDNTIVSEDDRYLSPGAEHWIDHAQNQGLHVILLSNGHHRYRVIHWSQRLDIMAISPARKPFPRGFRQALRQMNLSAHQVVVIGDSRHTDILGAWIVGCPSIQVATLPHPTRWWERLLGRWVQTPYSQDKPLWISPTAETTISASGVPSVRTDG